MAISKDLEETSADVTEASGFVLTSILTVHFLTLLTGHFTYEERRRRESNPRIGTRCSLKRRLTRFSIRCERLRASFRTTTATVNFPLVGQFQESFLNVTRIPGSVTVADQPFF